MENVQKVTSTKIEKEGGAKMVATAISDDRRGKHSF